MGKGGLNRLLLTTTDLTSPTTAVLPKSDARAHHICIFLSPNSKTVTLRVAVEQSYLHDAAEATIHTDGSISISLPLALRRSLHAVPNIVLLVAIQRPKVMARVLEAAATLGIHGICVIGAEKVEKSYWQSKLFRSDEGVEKGAKNAEDDDLPGRARPSSHEHHAEAFVSRRVDHVSNVRRRLQTGVEQACVDAALPWVLLEPRGMETLLDPGHEIHNLCPSFMSWTRLVAHPYVPSSAAEGSITAIVSKATTDGAALAIGPEGGWSDAEIAFLKGKGFSVVAIGHHVLRSETAVVVSLGLVHEGLRLNSFENGRPVGPVEDDFVPD